MGQENLIRDAVLEELNKIFKSDENIKAFAEQPRYTIKNNKNNLVKVDLSIVDKNMKENPFRVEFKFQYPNDKKRMADYYDVIGWYFNENESKITNFGRDTDMLILTIANWDKKEKKEYDDIWWITTNLSQYITDNEVWKENIRNSFRRFSNTILEEIKIQVESPYKAVYYFYILFKNLFKNL